MAIAFTAAVAQPAEWRTFAGGFSSRWKTVGLHGHDQPYCSEVIERHFPGVVLVTHIPCDRVDFSRGNLDNSIGYRAGRERDFLSVGPLHLVGGGEAAISYTEYNLTQADFALINAAIVAGADVKVRGVRLGGRYGAGPFLTTDGQELGVTGYTEFALTLPLRPGAALRLSHRHTETLNRYGRIAAPERLSALAEGARSGPHVRGLPRLIQRFALGVQHRHGDRDARSRIGERSDAAESGLHPVLCLRRSALA